MEQTNLTIPADYRVELLNIGKSFGGVQALKDVSLQARPGEIHALLGENGAGKSTLMKVLAGAHQRDRGIIRLDGQPADITGPQSSRDLGIGIIYQEFSLVPDLSVAENIYLNSLPQWGFWLRRRAMNQRAQELIAQLGFDINPRRLVRSLSVAQQQVVEIAKALSENVKVLILDEPSAVLAPQETQKLFSILAMLKAQGVTILYISHRLEEIFQIADRITVIKDGATVTSVNVRDVTQDDLITLMIGRPLETLFPARHTALGAEILRVENLRNDRLHGVSFSLRAGEVLGITGLVGSGRSEVLQAIFGADPKAPGSRVTLNGQPLPARSPREGVAAGIGFVSEDRKTKSVLLGLSIRENLSLTNLGAVTNGLGFFRHQREAALTDSLIDKLAIRTLTPDNAVGKLSGGNQQKVALAKWLGRPGNLLLIDEPTRGVDVGAKTEIYKLLNELTEQGYGVLVVSSEMVEVMGISDRILVMNDGAVQGELLKPDFSEENILRLSIAHKTTA